MIINPPYKELPGWNLTRLSISSTQETNKGQEQTTNTRENVKVKHFWQFDVHESEFYTSQTKSLLLFLAIPVHITDWSVLIHALLLEWIFDYE